MTGSRSRERVTAARVAALTRRLVACGLGALLAVACTTQPDAPEPPPAPLEEPAVTQVPVGRSVGIVLPAATDVDPGVLAAVEADVARLGATVGTEIRNVRAFTPDESAFVGDIASMLADRGTDLVCLVGERSSHGIVELAELHPDLHFCAAGVSSDSRQPDHVDLVEVRAAELGHVVGVAARATAGADGVVGLVLGGDETPASTFRAGLLAGLDGVEVVEANVETSVTDAVDEVLDDEATVVVVDGAMGATEALEHAVEQARVLAPSSVMPASTGNVVLTWRVRWDLVLQGPVSSLLGDRGRGPMSYGLAEDVFTVLLRPAATTVTGRAVETAMAEISDGVRDPLAPAAPDP